ncbi:hypothetical protein H4S08_002011, partial [Coemansia sp. RSA 1365]
MKLASSAVWSFAVASLALATGAAASPAQHVFAPHRPQPLEADAVVGTSPVRHAKPSLVSSTKWERIESMTTLPNYQLRVKQPKLCETNATQYSGYLDTDEDSHFFFWFFEARNAPKREEAPLIVWMNGGPGCSSSTGLLMELGPCRPDKGGASVSPHKYGWDDQAHVIFLDQPLN